MSSLTEVVEHENKEADTLSTLTASHGGQIQEAPLETSPKQLSTAISLPEIPHGNLDLELDMFSIFKTTPNPEVEKVKKRASNVLKLSQENEKLKAELQAMTDRLERAERRREELAMRQQGVMEAPSS